MPAKTDYGMKPLSSLTRWGWAAGGIADNLLFGSVAALTLPVCNLHFGIDPRWVGASLLVARVVEVVLDPVIGHVSDNFRSSWGRRRPFILTGALACAVIFPVLWHPFVSGPLAQALHVAVFLSLLSVFYGIFFVPFNALGYELSEDPGERTSVQAAFMVCGLAAGFVVPHLYPLALRLGADGGFEHGLTLMAMGVGLVIALTGSLPALVTGQRDCVRIEAQSSFRETWKAVADNRIFVRLLAAYACGVCGLFLWPALLVYLNTFGIGGGNEELGAAVSGFAGMAAVAGAVCGIGLGGLLARRWSKPAVLRAGLGLAALAALAMEHSLGANAWAGALRFGAWTFVLREQYLAFFLFGLGQQAAWLMFGSLVADLCDVEELRSGRRREGAYSAAFNIAFRLAVAIGALGSGYFLSWSGLKASEPTTASSGVLLLRHLLIFAQGAGALGSMIILGRFALSAEDVRTIQRRLYDKA